MEEWEGLSFLERSLCDETNINEEILQIQEMSEDTGKCLFETFYSGRREHLERCRVERREGQRPNASGLPK